MELLELTALLELLELVGLLDDELAFELADKLLLLTALDCLADFSFLAGLLFFGAVLDLEDDLRVLAVLDDEACPVGLVEVWQADKVRADRHVKGIRIFFILMYTKIPPD